MSPFSPEIDEPSLGDNITCSSRRTWWKKEKSPWQKRLRAKYVIVETRKQFAAVDARFSLDCVRIQYILPQSINDLMIFVDEILYLE